jgi:dienelactone hydrolase
MSEFVDATGRPGPATWEGGDYPSGRGDYPVSGVSWYEAAAYAEYAGKTLPTVLHWHIAAGFDRRITRFRFNSRLILLSNMEADAPRAVGSSQDVNWYGAYGMAGNVREWCWNESPEGRYLRGGAWNDVGYMYGNLTQAPAVDRSEKNGFRCVRYVNRQEIPDISFVAIQIGRQRDYISEPGVLDSVFEIFRERFLYDRTGLNPTVEYRDESNEDWVKEKVLFDAAYGSDRVTLYLFLPRQSEPPFQTVVYIPGNNVIADIPSDNLLNPWVFDFLPKNGRAVAYPVYVGTYERTADWDLAKTDPTRDYSFLYSEYLAKLVKDYRRTIDYLETRKDVDTDRLAYYGFSWGGYLGAIVPAIEDRLKASILYLGGFKNAFPRPDADERHYAPRVVIPTLMLNGRYDMAFPLEADVLPMFQLLGTPDEHKRLSVYDTDHFIPRRELIRETLAWLDKYLGPVERAGK